VKYTKEHLEIAKRDGLPLVKIEIDYRFVENRKIRTRQGWGAATGDVAAKLSKILNEDMG
jgi:hypothetical protein